MTMGTAQFADIKSKIVNVDLVEAPTRIGQKFEKSCLTIYTYFPKNRYAISLTSKSIGVFPMVMTNGEKF